MSGDIVDALHLLAAGLTWPRILRRTLTDAAEEITALRAEVERLEAEAQDSFVESWAT